MTVGVLPFLSPRLFADVPAATSADYVLFGLGDPGYQVANAVQQLGFGGRVTGIQLAIAGVPFRMFLTTPFAYEGLLRNTRAQRFKIAFEGDQRINYINLNDCLRDVWPTVSDGFNKYPAIKIYQILRSVNYF